MAAVCDHPEEHTRASWFSPAELTAAVLITSSETAIRLGLRARARLHGFAVADDDPLYMLTGIIPATRKVLDRAGLSLSDIGAFEVNEALASVALAWQAETGADLGKVSVHGGATGIGHLLAASGARLMTTLLSALEQHGGPFGLQTMCAAGGTANTTITERPDGSRSAPLICSRRSGAQPSPAGDSRHLVICPWKPIGLHYEEPIGFRWTAPTGYGFAARRRTCR